MTYIFTNIDTVLIDNDPLVLLCWKISAKRHGKSIRLYANPNDFIKEQENIPRSTPIYIDSNLDDNVKGEDIAQNIYQLGFTQIYLATGYPERFLATKSQLCNICRVVGKDPPWEK